MMPIVVLGAICISLSFGALWWAISGARAGVGGMAQTVAARLESVTDMRRAVLQHSASDRVIDPLVAKLSRTVRRLTPSGMLESLERRTVLAGASRPVDQVLAAKAG